MLQKSHRVGVRADSQCVLRGVMSDLGDYLEISMFLL